MLAKAMGAEVAVLSRLLAKADEAKACRHNGALRTLKSRRPMRAFDVILDTVAVSHPMADIVNTLKVETTSSRSYSYLAPSSLQPFLCFSTATGRGIPCRWHGRDSADA
jgi:hypothetical protein